MRRLTAALAVLAALTTGCASDADPPGSSVPVGTRTTSTGQGDSAGDGAGGPQAGGRLARLLGSVRVVPRATYHPGYDRSCEPGRACVFGPEWTDDHPGRFGHNGCDTREDVLLQQLRDIELRWGSRCRVYDGRLRDPYTGRGLTWQADGYRIQVDHVYPLAAAWHAGAWSWPPKRRLRLANDVDRELLAVGADANQEKGAATPADWMPPDRGSWCRYLAAYLRVAAAYDLPVTDADAAVVRRVAERC